MPPVRSISFDDGLEIICTGIPIFKITAKEIVELGGPSKSIKKAKETLNELLKEHYERKQSIANLDADDRAKQTKPILLSHERIEKIGGIDYWIGTLMYVQAHIFSLSPLKLTIRCSNSPITEDDWWL